MTKTNGVRAISRVALEESPAPGAWAERAACRGLPTDHFFSDDPADTETARTVCRPCPVRDDCVAYALALPGIGGIWGGLSEADRRRIRRRHGRHATIGDARPAPLRDRPTWCRSEAPRCRT